MSSNKTIAKNTVFLYIRMILWMVISLYTSRVILEVLGVKDYGIISVVGGIVGMFGFLNASMSAATSRFLSFELGKNDSDKLQKVFSSALIVHFIIALIVVILSETVGLWFFYNKLVVPPERFTAAFWVFQLSIFSAIIGIVQVPYMAVITAREKMNIYAYFEILNVILKLLIVLALPSVGGDKLIVYQGLLIAVSVFTFALYRFFCVKNFTETRFILVLDKQIIKPMLSFSGWDLYGNLGARVYQQGTAMLLNMFFGVVLNAAAGIATTVQGVVSNVASNITMAFRPQLIKQYAKGNIEEMKSLFLTATKLSTLLLVIIVTPLVAELNFVIKLWLGQIPPYTVEICRIILYTSIINELQLSSNIIIHATGNVKRLSFFAGTIFILSVIAVYFLFKLTNNPLNAYYFFVLVHLCILAYDLYIIKKQVPVFSIYKFIKIVLLPLLFLVISGFFIAKGITLNMTSSFYRFLLTCSITSIYFIIISYFFILTSAQKNFILNKIKFIKK